MIKIITKEQLMVELNNLGVNTGDLLNVKCSLKSVGKIDGGPTTLIEALLEVVGERGTIVTDSFVHVYPKKIAFKKQASDDNTPSYAGALANAMIKHPKSYRSKHPIQKFAAIGYLAKELTENHTDESYAYDVLRVMAERGGKNLKIGSDEKVVGVGTTHVAAGLLGFKQLRPIIGRTYSDANGSNKYFQLDWAGICAEGLINFMPKYEKNGNIISKGRIGNAEAKITDMNGTLKTELDILKKNPTFFMCDNPECLGCRLTWEFKKESKIKLFFEYLFTGKIKTLLKLIKMSLQKHRYLPDKNSRMPEKGGWV